MDNGFLPVPNTLIRNFARMRPSISAGELCFILTLMIFKWGDEAPFPSYKLVADILDLKEPMVRRYAKRLERKGYLRRIYRGKGYTNRFDLGGLFAALDRLGQPPNTADDVAA